MTSDRIGPVNDVMVEKDIIVVSETDEEKYEPRNGHKVTKRDYSYSHPKNGFHKTQDIERDLIEKLVKSGRICDLAEMETRANRQRLYALAGIEISVDDERLCFDEVEMRTASRGRAKKTASNKPRVCDLDGVHVYDITRDERLWNDDGEEGTTNHLRETNAASNHEQLSDPDEAETMSCQERLYDTDQDERSGYSKRLRKFADVKSISKQERICDLDSVDTNPERVSELDEEVTNVNHERMSDLDKVLAKAIANKIRLCDLNEDSKVIRETAEVTRNARTDDTHSNNNYKRKSKDCPQPTEYQKPCYNDGRNKSKKCHPKQSLQKDDNYETKSSRRSNDTNVGVVSSDPENVHDTHVHSKNGGQTIGAPMEAGRSIRKEASHPFSQSNDTSDLRLIVEGRPLYVSRVVLSLVSPVLKRLFASQIRDDGIEFVLPDKKYDDMLQFLLCVYPNILAPVLENNVEILLQLADEFHVKRLMDQCERFMVDDIERKVPKPHPDKIVRYLNISDKLGLERLQKATFQTAARTESNILENVSDFWDLPAVTTTSVFIRRLKLLEQTYKQMRTKLKEVQNHCSLYHKGDRENDAVCTRCYASIGKHAQSELKQLCDL